MKVLKLLVILFFLSSLAYSQRIIPNYYELNKWGLTSPGSMRYGLYGFDNPALLSTVDNLNMQFMWSDQNKASGLQDWALFTGMQGLGFGVTRSKFDDRSITDYRLSSSMGNKTLSLGFGYNWTSGDRDFFQHYDMWTTGLMYRPIPHLSLGAVGYFPVNGNNEGAFELAVRPFGNEKIALFGDYVLRRWKAENDIKYSVGVAVEAIKGLRITGRYFEQDFFNVGVELSLGSLGIMSQGHFNPEGNHVYNNYGIRLGGIDRTFLKDLFGKNNNYTEFKLDGPIKYQKFKWFDDSKTLYDILDQIKNAKEDKSVAGIALNLSRIDADKVMLWEIRETLKDFKKSGKKVVVYFDNANIDVYQLASVADKIVMDPVGTLVLEGFVQGRTFYKNTLEKLGIGYSEWRYFKYKSAMESFSRTQMSEADKQQRQDLIDTYYEVAKNDICEGRNLTTAKFDDIVNNSFLLRSEEAQKQGLVDSIGRWDKVKELVTKLEGDEKNFTSSYRNSEENLPTDDYWGEKPKLAIIYAIGGTMMTSGINAVKLSEDVKRAVEDDKVKAIVLRVDSPGGDALAADLVAAELKKAKGKKPIIVSQGYVAASGGYWLSMHADTIVAAPTTITGSIGVIAGWFYDKGLYKDLGFTTDHIKKGDHADVGYGAVLPLINMPLVPQRDLTKEEMVRAEKMIRTFYWDFVELVADARGETKEYIDSVAQGHFYSGVDGKKVRLVDVLGTMDDAIEIAKTKAGLKEGKFDVEILPEPGLFNFDLMSLVGVKAQTEVVNTKWLDEIRFRMENVGKPLVIMPLDF